MCDLGKMNRTKWIGFKQRGWAHVHAFFSQFVITETTLLVSGDKYVFDDVVMFGLHHQNPRTCVNAFYIYGPRIMHASSN